MVITQLSLEQTVNYSKHFHRKVKYIYDIHQKKITWLFALRSYTYPKVVSFCLAQ